MLTARKSANAVSMISLVALAFNALKCNLLCLVILQCWAACCVRNTFTVCHGDPDATHISSANELSEVILYIGTQGAR